MSPRSSRLSKQQQQYIYIVVALRRQKGIQHKWVIAGLALQRSERAWTPRARDRLSLRGALRIVSLRHTDARSRAAGERSFTFLLRLLGFCRQIQSYEINVTKLIYIERELAGIYIASLFSNCEFQRDYYQDAYTIYNLETMHIHVRIALSPESPVYIHIHTSETASSHKNQRLPTRKLAHALAFFSLLR